MIIKQDFPGVFEFIATTKPKRNAERDEFLENLIETLTKEREERENRNRTTTESTE